MTAYSKLIHRIEHLEPDIVSSLIGTEFTISQLYRLFTLAKPEQERSNFYRFLKQAKLINTTGKVSKPGTGRPARLYTFRNKTGEGLHVLY
jgi:hypothetical protein